MAIDLFHTNSIHNKLISNTATYVSVKDAIMFRRVDMPQHIYIDVVDFVPKDTAYPAVNVYKSQGFSGSSRRTKDATYNPGGVNGSGSGAGAQLSTFQCDPHALIQLSQFYDGNGHALLMDTGAGTAFDIYAGHRASVGADILTGHPIYSWSIVNISTGAKAANGAGLYNDGRVGSRGGGFSCGVGALQEGEITSGAVNHALGLVVPQKRFSKDVAWIWPARTCDSYYQDPTIGYAGPNPYFTMGTLLAIPKTVDLRKIRTMYGDDAPRRLTPAGMILGKTMQDYGAYCCDAVGTPDTGKWGLAATVGAAVNELGLCIDNGDYATPYTRKTLYSNRTAYSLDDIGNDLLALINCCMAVKDNYANFGLTDPGPAPAYAP